MLATTRFNADALARRPRRLRRRGVAAAMVALTVINLTATFPTEERPEHVTETSWLNMCARQLVRTAAGDEPTVI